MAKKTNKQLCQSLEEGCWKAWWDLWSILVDGVGIITAADVHLSNSETQSFHCECIQQQYAINPIYIFFYILLPVNLFFLFLNEHFWAPSKGWTIPYFLNFYFLNLLFTNSKVVGFKTKLCTFKCISAMQQCYSFSMKISLHSTDSELLNSFSMNIQCVSVTATMK